MVNSLIIDSACTDEIRIARIRNNEIESIEHEDANNKSLKGNIYLGIVSRVEASLQAAFVNYGHKKHGFIPFTNIHSDYHSKNNKIKKTNSSSSQKKNLCIKPGQTILVQVVKDERGSKGVTLNSYIYLAGQYLIFMPNMQNHSSISSKVESSLERLRLKIILEEMKITKKSSLIIKAKAEGKNSQEILANYKYLAKLWNEIKKKAAKSTGPCFIQAEDDIIKRTLRDIDENNIDEIIIDGCKTYNTIKQMCKKALPNTYKKIKLHKKSIPIFEYYNIESQILKMCNNKVLLNSGGYIVINKTEALTAIDVNSGKMTCERNLNKTALKTNLEAAKEIAKQLSIRNLSGLIIIDFIDMPATSMRTQIEKLLIEETKNDKAKIQIGNINTDFGVLIMSRQKINSGIMESLLATCDKCDGSGQIRNVSSIMLSIIRSIKAKVHKLNNKNISIVTVSTSNEIILHILNKHHGNITQLESDFNIIIKFITNHSVYNKDFQIDITLATTKQNENN
ncbi:putative Rne/Rng family ribonuclease [Candidatus Xenohaliotis californiensis]|uniref:Ribonuclease G n=1 Tax=Candidatus Xenohaliotis californiensis TaxID=84677 RepID=A0ABP0ERV7_9RICK|nr:putative Rne/Rng family ribonuclease [Candidatus Xenohaliotis californiensis]